MQDLWWRLPGPSHFVSNVDSDLRDGKNVVLRLPEHFPEGFVTALRNSLPDGIREQWERFHLDPQNFSSPIDLLFDRYVRDSSPEVLRNVASLISNEGFGGRLIWLSGMTSESWPAWKHFLYEYEHACRGVPFLQRTIFCVPLIGELALDPPAEGVCLSNRAWLGVVNYIDILLFSSSVLQSRPENPLIKRVAIFTIAGLALWDPEVVLRLSKARVDDILNPSEILRQMASERGWSNSAMNEPQNSWHIGCTNLFEGRERRHSAAISSEVTDDSIDQRIWNAEVSVMFPYVEEQRQALLGRLAGSLRVPFRTRFGEVISNVRDLEIGHIEAQLRSAGINPHSELIRFIQRLRDIRNRLAHLETLPLDLLTD